MNGRLLHLDILRAVAVLMVVGHHVPLGPSDTSLGRPFFEAWVNVGWGGVTLFFVLSGFLIGGLLFAEQHDSGRLDTRRFYIRRVFKIWPPYLTWLVVTLALVASRSSGTLGDRVSHAGWVLWPHFLHLQNYHYVTVLDRSTVHGHTWSLAVEEHFYLTLPLLLLVIGRLRGGSGAGRARLLPAALGAVVLAATLARIAVALTSDISASSTEAWYAWTSTHLRLDALALGVLLAYALRVAPERVEALRPFRLVLLMAGIACFLPAAILPMRDADPALNYVINYALALSLQAVGSIGAVLWAWFASHPVGGVAQVTALRQPAAPLRWLANVGAWSYSIYMWHFPYALIFGWQVASLLDVSAIGWRYPVFMVIYLGFAIVLGMCMHRLIERPALWLRDRVAPTRSRRAAPMSHEVEAIAVANA